MSTNSVSSKSGFVFTDPNTVNFVVDGEEFPIGINYLLTIEYFKNMFKNPTLENSTRRIEINGVSKEAVKAFIHLLTKLKFPDMDSQTIVDLYDLANQYQYDPMLEHVRDLLKDQIASMPKEILKLACLYNDAELKKACQQHFQNKYQYSLLNELIDMEAVDAIREVFTWPQNLLSSMLLNGSNNNTPFYKLLQKKMFLLASNLLTLASKMSIQTNRIVNNPQEAILELLNQESPPGPEQIKLMTAIATESPRYLTESNYRIENPPLFVALTKGWSEVFESMLTLCNEPVALVKNKNGVTLLSLGISLKKVWAIQALSKASLKQPIESYGFDSYVLMAIETKYLALILEVLKFPVKNLKVSLKCVQAALDTNDLTIVEAVWPYFKGELREIADLRKRVYDGNQLDLAKIIFSGEFDASQELYIPSDGKGRHPWLHYAAAIGSIEWIKFMASKSSDKNRKHSYSLKEHGSVDVTPLLLSLTSKRNSGVIKTLLEVGCNPNVGNSSFYPIHLAFTYDSDKILKLFLERKPDLSVINKKEENFFHLYLKSVWKVENLPFSKKEAYLQKDFQGNTPLHIAILNSKTRLTEALMLMLHNPAALWITNTNGKMPFHLKEGYEFELIVESFVDVAIKLENEETIDAMMLWCAEHQLYSQCEKLISKVSDIKSIKTPKKGLNLLHLATKAGLSFAVKKAEELGISIDSRDALSRTALHIAVENQDEPMVQTLLDLEASTDLCNKEGKNPLALAISLYKHPRTTRMQNIIDALEKRPCPIQ